MSAEEKHDSEIAIERAIGEGRKAFAQGYDLSVNPYSIDRDLHISWVVGYWDERSYIKNTLKSKRRNNLKVVK